MADVAISALPAATKLGVADLFAVVQGATTKKASIDLLPLLTGKIALVDGVNGVDGGQAVGETPFATIAAAITAANSAGGIGLIDVGPGTFTENSGFTVPDDWAFVGLPGLTKITSNLSDTTHAVLRPGNNCYIADLIVECTGANSSPIGIMSADTASTGSVFQRVKTLGLIDGFKVDKTGTNNFKAYDCISVTGPAGGTVDAVNSNAGTNNLEFWNCDFSTIGNSSTFSSPRGVVVSAGTVRLFNCKITTSAAGSSGNNQPLVASGGTIEAHNIRISRDGTGSVAADLTRSSGTLKVDNVVRDDGAALVVSGTITYLSRYASLDINNTFAGKQTLAVGTSSLAPINIPAGALQTTPGDGDIEADANCLYGCTDAGNRGVIPVRHIIRADSTNTLTSSTTRQKLFASPSNGRITLEPGVYFFKMLIRLSSMSATSGNCSFDILGAGTATAGSWLWNWNAMDGVSAAIGAWSSGIAVTAATPNPCATATTAAEILFEASGSFEVTGAGTLIPSVTLNTAAAAVVAIGSFFMCERYGSTSMASVGQWD